MAAGKGDSKAGIRKAVIFAIGFTLAIFHIYTSFFGALPSYQHRIVHLIMSMMLVPLCYDLFKCKNNTVRMAYEVLFIAILAGIGLYSYSIANDMWKQSGTMSGTDLVLGTFLVILLLLFTWRVVGAAMPVIAILC
ncbi:MAG: C4-dicarboxylate ABC transporter permease, partial [Lachnospiraceae bacterium]|nr:C4-dicarboxylate ABC transporter permease [Lachnospiraceae bacterium]